MTVNFLFLDDSSSSRTKVVALTGIVVPVDAYAVARSEFYSVLERVLPPEDGVIDLRPKELHGHELLSWHPEADDDLICETFEHIVNLVIDKKFMVFRSGCFRKKALTNIFKTDNGLLSYCWLNLLFMMQRLLAQNMLIPIMDGFNNPTVRVFSGMVKTMDQLRASGMESDVSVRYSENIIGEVFYADSKFSIFTQVADIIGYLRQLSDRTQIGAEVSRFQERLCKISERLAPPILHEEIVSVRVHTS